ncbi:MAG: DEAD/DEAH box helicase, partial [Mycobacterium sp.]
PEDEQAYVHRIGRTGRAGKTGIAITLVDWDELERWAMINTALKLDCADPAETYSNSPHFYSELGIPTEAGGFIGAARKAQGTRPPRDRDGGRGGGEKRERPARDRTRSRQRTRGGQSENGNAEKPAIDGDGATTTAEGGSNGRPRRRRRGPRKSAEAGAATS